MPTHLTPEIFDALMQQQEALEDDSLAAGAERFKRRLLAAQQGSNESTVGGAKWMLSHALEPVEAAMRHLVEHSPKGRPHMAKKWVAAVGPEVAAYMALKALFDSMTNPRPVPHVAEDIVELITDELRFRRLKEKAPKVYRYRMATSNTSSYAHMGRVLDASIRYAEIDTSDLELSRKDAIVVGTKLIDLVVESTGLFEVRWERSADGRSTVVSVAPTEETERVVGERNEVLAQLFPVRLPMVVPPLPWGEKQQGGYRFAQRGKYRMIRGRVRQSEVAAGPMVYAALNRIQETPWRINERVLSTIEAILDVGGGRAQLPATEPAPKPPKPHDIDTNEEAKKAWKRKAAEWHEQDHKRRVKLRELDQRVLPVAKRFRAHEAIWFPHTLDFRGRLYPVVNYLHPQGDDLCKGLLTFGISKPLGPHGAGWLALHGANCMGSHGGQKMSRMTLQERADWVLEHTEDIERSAEDPLGHSWWMDAEEPIQFLAFCFEWAGFMAAHREGRGEEYESSLPCAVDGSCNGLQHFAALLRDPVAAHAVNVSPTERPQDIYQAVADAVLAKLEREAVDEPLAEVWLRSGLVNRKLTKRPTMTFGYGSKQFGFTSQIMEEIQGRDDWLEIRQTFTDAEGVNILPKAARYMAACIWEGLGDVVVSAQKGMDWMQTAARMVAKKGRFVTWTVPVTDFKVIQRYAEQTAVRARTSLAGCVYKARLAEDTDTPSVSKQASAVAPNIIHSFDAAALMITVDMASQQGVEAFGMVHDSYATLAGDAAVLADSLRRAFFSFYTSCDVLGMLYVQLAGQYEPGEKDPEMPPPPAAGSLDISRVLGADYFFA